MPNRSQVSHQRGSQGSRLDWVLENSSEGISLDDLASQAGTTRERARSHLSWHLTRGGVEKLPNGRYKLTGQCDISGTTKPA
jgi:predicted ArsR family transcriptional regulator